MEVMRIGFDAKRAYHNFSGLGNYARYLIASIQQYASVEVFLFTPDKRRASSRHFSGTNAEIIHANTQSKFKQNLWRVKPPSEIFEKYKLDCFHGLSNELPLSLPQSLARVVTIHDVIFERYPQQYSYIDRKIYRAKTKLAIKNADRIIAISAQTRQDLVDFYQVDPQKIDLHYQDCDVQFHQEVSEDDKVKVCQKYGLPEHFILSVGTIQERKNQHRIVEAMAKAKIDRPLVLVGKQTDYIKEVRKAAANHRVILICPDDVSFFDFPAIYQSAELFVYPSLFEGFGIPVLEALNSGVPVVTSSGTCLDETGGPAANYVNPTNVEELGNAMQEFLQNRNLREERIQLGKVHAQQFRAEKTIPELIKVYRRAIDERKKRNCNIRYSWKNNYYCIDFYNA
jgi:glycosyltransferase involved in cell wall biosynthesis